MDHILIDRNISTESASDTIRLKFISNFLSYTDGIFSSDTKFVITTNQGVANIDTAILRKGRCFDVLSFRFLNNSEALAIWKDSELLEEDFIDNFSTSDSISAADLGAKIELVQNLVGKNITAKKSYIHEDGISLYRKSFTTKISI
jgi:SpoVK/Ycf46/Vps4 family AAA+-type ATPase